MNRLKIYISSLVSLTSNSSSNYSAFDPTHNHYKADGTYTTTGIAALEEQRVLQQQWINENIITYNFNIADEHSFGLLVGESTQFNGNKYSETKGENFLTNTVHAMDVAQNTSAYGREEKATLRSFFGRINYAYKNRYLLEANLRRDESSRIPKRTGSVISLPYLPDGILRKKPFCKIYVS